MGKVIRMTEEYEYSFKVKDIQKYLDYCKKNNYLLVDSCEQIRRLYKNGSKVMARITKNIYEDYEEELLSFKDDNLNGEILHLRRESEELLITDENRLFVESLLSILELKEAKVLKRKRVVYEKDGVKLEIDDYQQPLMKVVAIEGEKREVDNVYKDLCNLINEEREVVG